MGIKNLLQSANHIFIGAGAGMSVDSGLPDFQSQGILHSIGEKEFLQNPLKNWKDLEKRRLLYRETQPHQGYQDLLNFLNTKKSYFIYTSNVDGHFVQSGFFKRKVFEIHGNIHYRQCSDFLCERPLYLVDDEYDDGFEDYLCERCGAVTRPNVVFDVDTGWDSSRADLQKQHFDQWMQSVDSTQVLAIELGAGVLKQSIRIQSERFPKLIRVNLTDWLVDPPESARMKGIEETEKIGLKMSCLDFVKILKSLEGKK